MIYGLATIGDIYDVAQRMRERDYKEIVCTTHAQDRIELSDHIARTWSQSPWTYVFGTKEEGRIACLTLTSMRPGVWNVGLFATDKLEIIGKPLTKHVIKAIIPMIFEIGAHRVEAQSIVGYEEVHEWLRFLALKPESMLYGYGKNGENFINFAWVRKNEGSAKWQARKIVIDE